MSSRQSSRNASTPYLAKAFQATAIVVVSYFLYWTYQLYQYGEIPISKKDVMLRQAILARFPADYEVEIKGADLLGFGENSWSPTAIGASSARPSPWTTRSSSAWSGTRDGPTCRW